MSLTICRHLPLTSNQAEVVMLEHRQPINCDHRGSGRICPNGPTLSHRGSGRVSAHHPAGSQPSGSLAPQAWRGSGRVTPGMAQAWRGSGRISAIAA